ncbi:hypothetical protein NEAUS05_0283 [Nematocida ausubeli]|nr:hypothetical protein NEAUS05_0283 [Nematocida ausubeli]
MKSTNISIMLLCLALWTVAKGLPEKKALKFLGENAMRAERGVYTDKIANIDGFTPDDIQSGNREFEILQEIPEHMVLILLCMCCGIIGYCIGLYLDRVFMYAEYVKRKVSRYAHRISRSRTSGEASLDSV